MMKNAAILFMSTTAVSAVDFVEIDMKGSPYTYQLARETCASQDKSYGLCSQEQLGIDGQNILQYPTNGDQWMPVSNSYNEWVSVGDFDVANRLGRKHSELFGKPVWGTNNDPAQRAPVIVCCPEFTDDTCRTVVYETVECNEYTKKSTKEVVIYDTEQVCEKKQYYKNVELDCNVRRDVCDFEIVTNDVVTRIPSFVKDCSTSGTNGKCGIKTEITEVITQDTLCDWECAPAHKTEWITTQLPYYVTECTHKSIERWVSVPVKKTEKVCQVVEKEYEICSGSESVDLVRMFEESVFTYTPDSQSGTQYLSLD